MFFISSLFGQLLLSVSKKQDRKRRIIERQADMRIRNGSTSFL
jgi:hypothetical protein